MKKSMVLFWLGVVVLLFSTRGYAQDCLNPIAYGNFQTAQFQGIGTDTNFVQQAQFTGQNFLADLNYLIEYRADFEPTLNLIAAEMIQMDLAPVGAIVNTAQFSNFQQLGYQSNAVGFLYQAPCMACAAPIYYVTTNNFKNFLAGTESPTFEAILATGQLAQWGSFTSTATIDNNNVEAVDFCQLSLQGPNLVECTRSTGLNPNPLNLIPYDYPVTAVYSTPVFDIADTFYAGVNLTKPLAIEGRLISYQVSPSGLYTESDSMDFTAAIANIARVDAQHIAVTFEDGQLLVIEVNANGTIEVKQEYETANTANYQQGYTADETHYEIANTAYATFTVSGRTGTIVLEVDPVTFALIRPGHFTPLEPDVPNVSDLEFGNAQLLYDYDDCNGNDYEVLSYSPSLNQSFHSVALAEGQLSAFTVNTTENDPLCPNGTLVTFNATYCNSFPTFAFNLSDPSGGVTMQTIDDSHLCVINTSGEGDQTLTITVAPTNANGDPCGPVSDQFVVAIAPSGAIQMRGNCIANLNGTSCGPQAADAWLLLVPAALWVLRKRLSRA